MRFSFRPLILAAAMFVARPPATHAVELITGCGQFVRGSAILGGDLDCSATADDAVKLQGRLHLAGFTITASPAHDGVRCLKGACRIEGPGTITGGATGVHSEKNTRLIGVTIRDNVGAGVDAVKTARIDDSSIASNGGDGVDADKITAYGSGFVDNAGAGAHTVRKATFLGCSITGNGGDGVRSDRLAKVSHITVVSENGLDGIDAGRIMLKRGASSTLNGTDAACGVTQECDDIATAYRPVVSADALCGTSRDTTSADSWHACLND
jgi:hypothetical protein